MTTLRALNARGIEEFRGFLQQIRNGAEFRANPAILYIDDYSPRLPRSIEITPRTFATKFDAARYLAGVLADLPAAADDAGLWSWLALFYFDQLSPVDVNGKRRPREDYHYIPSNSGWQRDRHLLAGPYKLYALHNENARLLLHPPVHQHGAFIYDLGFRRDLITNKGLVEAIDLLYWDAKRNRPKRGDNDQPSWQPAPAHQRRAAARLQLRSLRDAFRRDPGTAAAGIRRLVAGTAADSAAPRAAARIDVIADGEILARLAAGHTRHSQATTAAAAPRRFS